MYLLKGPNGDGWAVPASKEAFGIGDGGGRGETLSVVGLACVFLALLPGLQGA